MGKHLVRIYVCLRTQPLHGRPDIAAVYRLAGPGTEDMPAFDSRAAHVLQQDVLQPSGNQDASRLTLARDGDFAARIRGFPWRRAFAAAATAADLSWQRAKASGILPCSVPDLQPDMFSSARDTA